MSQIPHNIQAALDYSRNFATAKPNIGNTEREHILGLANLLEKTAIEAESLRNHREIALKALGISLDEWSKLSGQLQA